MNGVLGALHLERQRRKEFAETRFAVPGHPGGVIVREKHGECLGASVWASSQVLTRFLAARLESQNGGATRAPRVLELGCGVGLPGIFCALKGCSVTLTDRDEVLAITRENVLANGVASKAHVAELVWGSDPLPPFALEEPYDLVIGADVLYRQEHLEALLHTLLQVAHVHTEVLIAYKQRIKCDEAFFAAASRHFDITTAWSQADARNEAHADGSLRGGPHTGEETGVPAEADFPPHPDHRGAGITEGYLENRGRVGSAGQAQPRVTGDWVSGASCCILRFLRRPPQASREESLQKYNK